MSQIIDELDDIIGVKARKVCSVIAVLIAVYIISGLIFGLWPFSTARGLVQKTTSAEAIISNYQWYYDQYNAIQAQKANLSIMAKDSQEYKGSMMVLNRAIGEYNSRSKQVTRNMWKAQDLPYSITMEGVE